MNNNQKRKIRNIVKEISPYIVVKFGKYFECDLENCTIYIGTKKDKITNRSFKRWYRETFNETIDNKKLFYIQLFHEIGHLFTYTEELDNDRYAKKIVLNLRYSFGLISADSLSRQYFEIPMELEATKWANNQYKKFKNTIDF